jgi:hypothetical protein
MSYQAKGFVKKRLMVAFFQWGSGGAVNTACPLTLLAHTWSDAPVINGGGDGVVLPQGAYMASAYVYATRATASQNIRFQFYLDGAAVGMAGTSDVYLNGSNVDQADCEVVVPSGEATIELKITGVETSIPTLASDCRLVLWRIDT